MPVNTTTQTVVYAVALGGNQRHPRFGVPLETLRLVCRTLDNMPGVRVLAVSRFYRTAPMGPKQAAYVNAAVLIRADLSPPELLVHLQALEAAFGRVRRRRWGPRVLDLDIVAASIIWPAKGGCRGRHTLRVPHAAMQDRAFVLRPLCDIWPDWRHPVLLRTTRQMLARQPRRGIQPLG